MNRQLSVLYMALFFGISVPTDIQAMMTMLWTALDSMCCQPSVVRMGLKVGNQIVEKKDAQHIYDLLANIKQRGDGLAFQSIACVCHGVMDALCQDARTFLQKKGLVDQDGNVIKIVKALVLSFVDSSKVKASDDGTMTGEYVLRAYDEGLKLGIERGYFAYVVLE